MENRNVMEKRPSEQYKVKTVVIDYDTKSFVAHMPGYKPVDILFIEVESFMEEYDTKLYEYLLCKHTMPEKVSEAVDIGFDFGPMIADLLTSFIEYGLIDPPKI
jgi:hypothetical protein